MRYAMLGLLVWVLGCGESFKPDLFPAGGAGGEIGLGAGAGPGGQTASGGAGGTEETGGATSAAGSTSGQAGAATGGSVHVQLLARQSRARNRAHRPARTIS